MIKYGMGYEDLWDLLNDINSTILLNDAATRNSMRDLSSLMKITEYLYSKAGNLISPFFTSKELKMNDKTVNSYLRIIEGSLLVIRAPRYDMVGKKSLKGTCKYYATDTGIRNAYLRSRDRDIGRLAENAVFLELKRRGYMVAVGKYGDAEIDFTADKNSVTEYYQVAKTIVDETVLKREIKPFEETDDNYLKTIITWMSLRKRMSGG